MPRRYKLGRTVRCAGHGAESSRRNLASGICWRSWRIRTCFWEGAYRLKPLSAIHAAGYDYTGGRSSPVPERRIYLWRTHRRRCRPPRSWRRPGGDAPSDFRGPHRGAGTKPGHQRGRGRGLRVEQNLAAATIPIEVSVRPIEPQGKLIGFASVNFGGVVVDDFKVVNGQNGVF